MVLANTIVALRLGGVQRLTSHTATKVARLVLVNVVVDLGAHPAGAFDGRDIHTELLLRDLSRIASSSIINIDGCLHMISDAVHIERLVTVCSSFYRAVLLIVRHTEANTGLNL